MNPIDLEEKECIVEAIVNKLCDVYTCHECPLDRLRDKYTSASLTCSQRLLRALHEDATPPVTPHEPPSPPKPALPKWCKVGTWVYICQESGEKELGRITYTEDGSTAVDVDCTAFLKRDETRICPVYCLRPVRFRPYTFEEAKALIGKKVEYTYKDPINFGGEQGAFVVSMIRRGLISPRQIPIIDSYDQKWLIGNGATIDGVPFGVPEIDTEAEKEAKE